MNLTQFFEIGGFVILVGGLIWNFAWTASKNEATYVLANKTAVKSEESVKDFWKWKNIHEKDETDIRFATQERFGRIEATMALRDGQYGEIVRMIGTLNDNISEKMDRLEKEIASLKSRLEK